MTKRLRKTLDITEMDIIAEIEAMRSKPDPRVRQFTREQDVALYTARDPKAARRVAWYEFIAWWEARGWGRVNEQTLRRRMGEIEADGGL